MILKGVVKENFDFGVQTSQTLGKIFKANDLKVK